MHSCSLLAIMAVAGIYHITHTKTLKTYVGQSNNVDARLTEHRSLLNKGAHHCQALQRLWTTGNDSFTFILVEAADEDVQGYALQKWLNEREIFHYKSLSDRGLCLNSTYPTLVHAGDSQMEMLVTEKANHRRIAAEAEAKRKPLADQMWVAKKQLEECNKQIAIHEAVLNRTTGFFAFIFGRSNPVEAETARKSLQPLFAQREVLQSRHNELWKITSTLESERRTNNSIARRLGSRQKEVTVQQKRRKK